MSDGRVRGVDAAHEHAGVLPALRANSLRDTWCGALRRDDAARSARVAGWVHRRRDHGGLIFIDLRDRTGVVQLVFRPEVGEAFAAAERLRPEHVISAAGKVVRREPANVNPNLPTGEVELDVEALDHHVEAETPPFPVDEDRDIDELIRLRHRVIDLRRAPMREAIELRHRVTRTIRDELDAQGFLEIETPILTRATPEGARDFLVPARLEPGSFFALPQSPQLFKQLLMISGFERYYQIARCFRDEASRADRQFEFTQLDLEMAFVEQEDVIEANERVMERVFALGALASIPPPPYERIGYDEAIARYGSDRPDRRFGLEIVDVGEAVSGSQFKVFSDALRSGGVVRAINAGAREAPRAQLDELTELAKRNGAKGLVWAFVQAGCEWRSPIAKFLTDGERAGIGARLGASEGDLLFIVADAARTAASALGALRLELARRWELVPDGAHDAVWVVDWPMFERDEETGAWSPLHHPFTQPVGDLDGDPGALRSRAYDLVVDGSELGGGSIRINRPEVQLRVLELLGIEPDEARARFGFLLDALRRGAPPHGGIAFGLDRIVAILAGRDSIRDVIAFPKTASGADPLTGAPAPVDPEQLRELAIRVDPGAARKAPD